MRLLFMFVHRLYLFLLGLILFSACTEPDIDISLDLEYKEVLALSKQDTLPIFLLITSVTCANDFKARRFIAGSRKVQSILEDEFLIYYLYLEGEDSIEADQLLPWEVNWEGRKKYRAMERTARILRQACQSNTSPTAVVINHNEVPFSKCLSWNDMPNELYNELKSSLAEYHSH